MRSLGQFVLFLSIVMVIVGGWQFYLWTKLVRDPAWPEPFSRLATAALILMTLAPPLVVAASRWLSRPVLKGITAALYSWFGMAFLLALAFFATDLARWILRGVSWVAGNAPPDDPERRKVIARGVAEAAGLTVAALGAVSVRSALADVDVPEVNVKLARLPPRSLRSHVGAADRRAHRSHHRPQVSRARGREPTAPSPTRSSSPVISSMGASLRCASRLHLSPSFRRATASTSSRATTNITPESTSGSPSSRASVSGCFATSASPSATEAHRSISRVSTITPRTASALVTVPTTPRPSPIATPSESSFCSRISRVRLSRPRQPAWAFSFRGTPTEGKYGLLEPWYA